MLYLIYIKYRYLCLAELLLQGILYLIRVPSIKRSRRKRKANLSLLYNN